MDIYHCPTVYRSASASTFIMVIVYMFAISMNYEYITTIYMIYGYTIVCLLVTISTACVQVRL